MQNVSNNMISAIRVHANFPFDLSPNDLAAEKKGTKKDAETESTYGENEIMYKML